MHACLPKPRPFIKIECACACYDLHTPALYLTTPIYFLATAENPCRPATMIPLLPHYQLLYYHTTPTTPLPSYCTTSTTPTTPIPSYCTTILPQLLHYPATVLPLLPQLLQHPATVLPYYPNHPTTQLQIGRAHV